MALSGIGASNFGAYFMPAATGVGAAAQSSASIGAAANSASAVDDFMTYMKETPAQKMRDKIVASLGLTDAKIAKMSPKDRAAVEQRIADILKQEMKDAVNAKTGILADVKV